MRYHRLLLMLFVVTSVSAEDGAEPSIESLGLPMSDSQPAREEPVADEPEVVEEPGGEEVAAEESEEVDPSDNLVTPIVVDEEPTPTPVPRNDESPSAESVEVEEQESAQEEVKTKSKYKTKLIINVTMSRANIQYAIKKKKFGRMVSRGSKGLLVKEITPESLLESLAVEKGDVVVELEGEDLIGRAGMKRLVRAAQNKDKFEMIVLRDGEYILFKMQQ